MNVFLKICKNLEVTFLVMACHVLASHPEIIMLKEHSHAMPCVSITSCSKEHSHVKERSSSNSCKVFTCNQERSHVMRKHQHPVVKIVVVTYALASHPEKLSYGRT